MPVRTTTTVVRTLIEGDDEFELTFEPSGILDPIVQIDDDTAHVGYLVDDLDCADLDPSEEYGAPEFILFRDGQHRNEWFEEQLNTCTTCWATKAVHADKHRVAAIAGGGDPACDEFTPRFEWTPTTWWVERYEHGRVRYALTGESSHVDRRWDVAGGVAVLKVDPAEWGPDDWTQGDYENAAREWLDSYTAWCNGDVFGVVVEHYHRGDGVWVHDGDESCWGYIGDEWAEQALRSEYLPEVTQ